MAGLFTKERLDRVVQEMGKHRFPAHTSGEGYSWRVTQDKGKLVFSHPLTEGLVVEVSDLEPLGEEGVELGYRASHYAALVVVNLPAHLTWPDVVPREFEEVTLYPGSPYEQKGKIPKMERKAVRNQARVSLGQANSRREVLGHLGTGFVGDVERLLKDLDVTLGVLFWSQDRPPSSGRQVDWAEPRARSSF
jgi:hypothetical protein